MTTTTRRPNEVPNAELRTYQNDADYQQDYLNEVLTHATKTVQDAQAALRQAEELRRVNATIAHRANKPKTEIAAELGISRPTLDAWLAATEASPGEMERVTQHETFLRREIARGAKRYGI